MTTPDPDPSAAGNGTSKRQPPARSTAKTAKATKAAEASAPRRSTARGSRAPAAAKRQTGSGGDTATSATSTRSRRRAAAAAPDRTVESADGDLASSRPWHRPWPGRGRSVRGIYDRSRQRGVEQWSPLARAVSWLFARPELVLSALGSPPTVEVDGRVLNRSVQAAVALLERLPGAEAEAWAPGGDVAMARLRMRQSASFLMPLRTDVYSIGRVIPGPDGAPPISRPRLPAVRGVPSAAAAAAPGHRLLPRWRMGDRRPRCLRTALPAARRRHRLHGGVGRLPAGARAPLPRRSGRCVGRLPVGPPAHRRVWASRRARWRSWGTAPAATWPPWSPSSPSPVVADRRPTCPPPLVQGLVYPAIDARWDRTPPAP